MLALLALVLVVTAPAPAAGDLVLAFPTVNAYFAPAGEVMYAVAPASLTGSLSPDIAYATNEQVRWKSAASNFGDDAAINGYPSAPLPVIPIGLVAGDFGGTGFDDVAWSLHSKSGIEYANTTSSGSFALTTVGDTGLASGSAVAADVDGDGRLDIVYASFDGSPASIGWARNVLPLDFVRHNLENVTGDATVTVADFFSTGGSSPPLMASCSGSGIRFYDTMGNIYSAANLPCNAMATGNLNPGGAIDIVYAQLSSVKVILNAGAFSTSTPNAWGTGTTITSSGLQSVYSIGLGDFDEDGDLDLVAASGGTAKRLSLWEGSGTGAFASQINLATTNELPITVVDMNNDGLPDILGGNLTRVHVRLQKSRVVSSCAGETIEHNATTTGNTASYTWGLVSPGPPSAANEDCIFRIISARNVVFSATVFLTPGPGGGTGIAQLFDKSNAAGTPDLTMTIPSVSSSPLVTTGPVVTVRWIAPVTDGAAFTINIITEDIAPSPPPGVGAAPAPQDSSNTGLVIAMVFVVIFLCCFVCVAGVLAMWKADDRDLGLVDWVKAKTSRTPDAGNMNELDVF